MDIPLFHRAVSQGEQITAAAQPVNVPDRLRRRVLCADIQKGVGAGFYGSGNSLAVNLGGQLLNPYQIQVANLSGADGSWVNLPPADSPYTAVIDPELGRIALPAPAGGAPPPELTVSYYYGFNADMGGGEYSRGAGFTVSDPAWILPYPDTASVPRYADLQQALNFAVAQLALNGQVAVEVSGSDTQPLPGALDGRSARRHHAGVARGRRRPPDAAARRRVRGQRRRFEQFHPQRLRARGRRRHDARQPGARRPRPCAGAAARRRDQPAWRTQPDALHAGPRLGGRSGRRRRCTTPRRP